MAPRSCGSLRLLQHGRIGLDRLPLALRVLLTEIVAQRVAAAGRARELLRELAQHAFAREVAAGARDLVAQHARIGEVLEQRDDVGERLVEGEHILIHRLVEARVHAVEQRVRGLVRDDVVRQASEYGRAGRVPAVFRRGLEIAEQQRLLLRAVIGVLLAQRVRIDAQPART